MKLLFSKMSLICVIFIAFFCVGCGKDSDEDGDGQNSAMQTDKRSGLTKEQDKLNAELEKLRGVCKCYDDSRDERAVYELSRTVTDDPSNVGAIVDDVLSADDPNAVKFKILALGYSREEEGKAGLLRILMSDIDPRIKLIAAAAYGMSPNGKRMLLPLSEGGVFVWVGEVDSEEALQAIAVEWRNGSGGRLAGELYYQLLKASAPQSSVAVDALWDYVTDGENPVELVKDVSKYLKANPSFQSSLVSEVLNGSQEESIRYAAVSILADSSVKTLNSVSSALNKAMQNQEEDILTRGLAFESMDTSVRNDVEVDDLNALIADENLPDDIRKDAMKTVQAKVKSGAIKINKQN